jgi:hypothetical protein
LVRIGKREDAEYPYCEGEDTPQHTIFHCPRWEVGRTILAERLDCELTPENLVEEMLRSDERCKMVESFLGKIMMTKQKDELEIGMQQ